MTTAKMAKKTLKLSTVFNLALGLLLFVLGVVVGYRFQDQISSFSTRLVKQNSDSVLSRVVGKVTPPPSLEADFSVFWEVWGLLENEYLDADKLDANKMVDGAIQGMTQAAGDPYTIYLPPEDNKRSGEDLQGSFFGVGIELGYIDGVLAIVAPLAGTPAAEAGLEAGDLI
ncbi:MAG TPA: hypothetical protein PLM16_03155, partial [Candidatus Woesebacteria bacterium]|nr:hypothetical protein [Candidatus Woesebacteria bacterium]